MALTPQVVDIPLGNLDQVSPKHSGPVGKLLKLVNGEIVQYDEAHPSGPPQRNVLRQRPGFGSLTTDIRDARDGNIITDDAHNPRLLAPIGDQLVRINHSKPEVLAERSWIRHDKLILTESLSQQVVHTSNRTIQAPDSAWLGAVECVVWSETDVVSDVSTCYIGFRDAEGAWIVVPRALFVGGASVRVLGRVVTDGQWFWVFTGIASADNIEAYVYNDQGNFKAQNGLLRQWLTSPGYWDITATPQTVGGQFSTVLLAQPNGFGAGTDVNVQLTGFSYDDNTSSVSLSSVVLTTPDCSGKVGWLSSNLSDGIAYLGTVGTVTTGNANVKAYQITNGVVTKSYSNAATVPENRVDAITGYVSAGAFIGLTVSLLSKGPFTNGPLYDPALRAVVTWAITPLNVATFVGQHNGVLLQSRAFQIDDDWYAVTYYQSGPGNVRAPTPTSVSWTSGDSMSGQAVQPIVITAGDTLNGSPQFIGAAATLIMPTQAIAAITHNGGDSVIAATAVFTLLNAAFVDDPYAVSAIGSYLSVSGATPSSLNTLWRVISRPDATHVIVDPVGANGTALVDSSLAGATCQLQSVVLLNVPVHYGSPENGEVIPSSVAPLFIGGKITVAGAAAAGNNGDYTIRAIFQHVGLPGYTNQWADVTQIVGLPPGTSVREIFPTTGSLKASPTTPFNKWLFNNETFSAVDDGAILRFFAPGDFTPQDFTITDTAAHDVETAGAIELRARVFTGSETASIVMGAAATYIFNLQSVTFNQSYIGALIIVTNAANPANNGTYVIRAVLSAHVVATAPATGATGQRNEAFANTIGVTITKSATTAPGLQPCWFISPLSTAQQTAGRFDYGIAYADWRYDSETVPNYFPLALSSVALRPFIGLNVSLPYRAQSFTADQIVKVDGNPLSLQNVLQTTVGIKDFLISVQSGQAVNSGQTMLIPGPRASQFSLSGFGEQSVNLAFEKPYLVGQSNDASVTGLLPGVPYQVILVAECTDENGDHVFSLPSLALDFTLTGNNNVADIGARMIGPTDRVVAISIYRTATLGGIPTTQHYRITSPLDVNGMGFTFGHVGYTYGSAADSFIYEDKISDTTARTGEVLYTDKGYLPRYPAPAFKQGTIWRNRAFLIGWDGAIWMSGEKTDGDSLWFHPALRFVLPTANTPVAVAPMDDYLIVLCGEGQQSYWYIPAANFPDGTGQNGTLPNPVALQFQGSCSGFALGTRNGVAYSNTAGGVWLITRNLTNVWISQAAKGDLTTGITGMSVDNNQRFYVSDDAGNLFVFDQISNTWWQWLLPAPISLLTTFKGQPVYQDAAYTMECLPEQRFDLRGTDIFGCPPAYELADLDFGGVRSFKCLWEMQVLGTYKGPHNLNVELSYPDEIAQVPTEFTWTPVAGEEFVYSFNPEVEQSSTYHIKVWVDFDGVPEPADSFEWELLAAEVGIQPGGLNKLPSGQQKVAK